MKKSFYLLIFLVAMFIGIGNVKAVVGPGQIGLEDANTEACTIVDGKTVCKPKITFGPGQTYRKNTFKIKIWVYNSNFDVNNVTYGSEFYEVSRSGPENESKQIGGVTYNGKAYHIVIASRKTVWSPSTVLLGTFEFSKVDSGDVCKAIFSLEANPSFVQRHECEIVNGYYYNKEGDSVTETEYRKSCLMCKKDDSAGKYYGIDGRDLSSYTEWDNECNEHSCAVVGDTYYGKDGSVVNKLKYYEDCRNPRCEIIVDGNTKEYYDTDGKKTTEDEYRVSCLYCEIIGDTYYGKDGKEVSKFEHEKQCNEHICEILSDGTHFDKNGKEVTEAEYNKSCLSCTKAGDKYYDKDGDEVSESQYLLSCFKCRKENDKYYDDEGKETSKENWDIMCTPHKCEIIGDHYFNDMGKDVPEAEWKKACENPKTGSTDIKSLSYIVSGLLLGGAIVFLSARYNKLRRI